MVKCPQCLQLRDDGDTPCPHCGETPYGIRNKPSQRLADPNAPPAAPREESKKLGYGGAELDFGDISTAGLDLAGDDDASTLPAGAKPLPALVLEPLPDATPPPRKIMAPRPEPLDAPPPEEAEARRLADYGDPAPGPIGAVRYWWRVSTRRSELARRRAEAAEAHDRLDREQTARLAALGRAAEAERPADGEPRAGLVRSARAAEKRRDEEANVAAAVVSERERRHADLRARLAELEGELAPLVETAAGAKSRHDGLGAEARRAEAAMKRSEIERRNVAELIARRQEAFADLARPAEERQRLLDEIAELDKRSPELNQRADEARAKLEALARPLAEAASDHETAERLVAERRGEAEKIGEKIEEAELELEAERARSGERFRALDRDAEKAWAAVGENALPTVDARAAGPLAGMARAAADRAGEVEAAARRLALLDRAVGCYDPDAFSRGRTFAIVGGAAALAVLTTVIVILIS